MYRVKYIFRGTFPTLIRPACTGGSVSNIVASLTPPWFKDETSHRLLSRASTGSTFLFLHAGGYAQFGAL